MDLTLDRCDVFVRGHFNPHIVSPEWLAEQGIWKTQEVQFGLGVLRQGLQFRSKQVEWLIDTEGMVISSLEQDCGELAASVIEKLPHTPIAAVGNNFNYVGKVEDWSRSPLASLATMNKGTFTDLLELDESKWSGTFRYNGVQLGVSVAVGTDGDAVSFNFHRPTKKPSRIAAEAARQFSSDKQASRTLLAPLLRQE